MWYFATFILMLSGLLGVNAQNIPNSRPDFINQHDKIKVVQYCEELVIDITRKVHQTDVIFLQYGNDFIFELGYILGQMREKHKMQMEYYRQAVNKYHRKAQLYPPEYLLNKNEYMRPFHYFLMMEQVHKKEIEIDTLVETLIRIPQDVLAQYPAESIMDMPLPMLPGNSSVGRPPLGPGNPEDDAVPTATSPSPRTAPGPPPDDGLFPNMRSPKDTGDTKQQKTAHELEAELKRRNRAQFLIRHGKNMFTRQT